MDLELTVNSTTVDDEAAKRSFSFEDDDEYSGQGSSYNLWDD